MDSDNVKRGVAADSIHKILSFIICIKDTVKTMVLSSRYRFIWTTMPYLNFSTDRLLDSKKRRKEKPIDRLSSLPDDLIHNILSFVSIEDAVKTMVLSSRYRFIWTTMPCLDFSSLDYKRAPQKFVRQFLKRRDGRIDVSSLKLSFRICGKDTNPYARKLMDYAFSHNIQRLDVKWLFGNDFEFPLSFFSSPSLKHLSLERVPMRYILTPTSPWELPYLTTLYLQDIPFCIDDPKDNCVGLISKCPNLKNLTVKSCQLYGFTSFSIGHPGLSDLTLDGVECFTDVSVLNVVAPQLENLTIRCHYERSFIMHEISAPKLASFAYEGDHPLLLNSTDGFPCLKEADILVFFRQNDTDAHQLVCMLQQLQYVESLKLNLEIIELLSSSVELISHKPSPFVNLKSLTIYPEKIFPWETEGLPKGKVDLSSEVKRYLLDSSPGATFTMFSREEVIAVRDVTSARKLMGELQVLLEQEKASTKTKRKARMESDNTKMRWKRNGKAETEMQLQIGGNIALIKSCWNKLNLQLKQQKAHLIISKLDSIEGLLKKLPATNRAMIEPCFSSLSTEAVIVMRKLTEDIKIECDENQKRLTVGFH